MKKILISDSNFWSNDTHDLKSNSGIYQIQCFEKDSNVIMPIRRVLGIDKEGILYIGKTVHFGRRINSLIKSFDPLIKGQGHICGRRYNNDTNVNIRDKFPFKQLCITLIQDDDPKASEEIEIIKYAKEFGVPPVLNRFG